jgi:hypothetical protein
LFIPINTFFLSVWQRFFCFECKQEKISEQEFQDGVFVANLFLFMSKCLFRKNKEFAKDYKP